MESGLEQRREFWFWFPRCLPATALIDKFDSIAYFSCWHFPGRKLPTYFSVLVSSLTQLLLPATLAPARDKNVLPDYCSYWKILFTQKEVLFVQDYFQPGISAPMVLWWIFLEAWWVCVGLSENKSECVVHSNEETQCKSVAHWSASWHRNKLY